MSNPVLDLIARTRIIAIVRLPALEDAVALSRALLDGGGAGRNFRQSMRDLGDGLSRARRRQGEFENAHTAVEERP